MLCWAQIYSDSILKAMLIIHAQQIHFFFQIDRNLKIGHGFNVSDDNFPSFVVCLLWHLHHLGTFAEDYAQQPDVTEERSENKLHAECAKYLRKIAQ